MIYRARVLFALSLALLAPLAGCGPDRITDFDVITRPDSSMGIDGGADAPRDAPRPTDGPRTDTPMGTDVSRSDTPVPTDAPRDTVTPPRDSGGGGVMCVSSCDSDEQCQTTCPSAAPGYINCCLSGSGGGTCYQNMGSSCPGGGGTDGGGMTGDGGFGMGCEFMPRMCTSDTDCASCGMGWTCFPGFNFCFPG